jgi:hypothetical protein
VKAIVIASVTSLIGLFIAFHADPKSELYKKLVSVSLALLFVAKSGGLVKRSGD